MFNLSDDQKIQLLLVGGPIVSLIGTWMSLRTYGRLRRRGDRLAEEVQRRERASADEQRLADEVDRAGHDRL